MERDPFDVWMEFMYGTKKEKSTGKDIRLEFKFEDIEDFYSSCEKFDKNLGKITQYNEILNEHDSERSRWVGLMKKKILESKYSYPEGISKLEEVKEDLLVTASSSFKNKWEDVDGEEMSMERMYDELPFMSKRVRKHGFLNGKFIKLFISIDEHSGIEYEKMLNKTYTAVSIIDYLESMGYRTEVYATVRAKNVGTRGSDNVKQLYVEIPIKKIDEILNIGLLLTLLSPWAFRYWTLLLMAANIYTNWGMGQPSYERPELKYGTLYINTGDCLSKESSQDFIKQIKLMYDQNFQEELY